MNNVNVTLDREEWRKVLLAIGSRQQDCRRVKENEPGFAKFKAVEIELEKVKMAIANQLPPAKAR